MEDQALAAAQGEGEVAEQGPAGVGSGEAEGLEGDVAAARDVVEADAVDGLLPPGLVDPFVLTDALAQDAAGAGYAGGFGGLEGLAGADAFGSGGHADGEFGATVCGLLDGGAAAFEGFVGLRGLAFEDGPSGTVLLIAGVEEAHFAAFDFDDAVGGAG